MSPNRRLEQHTCAGTGKTTTSVQVLRGWAALRLRSALCVAECNVAVDNIAMGLAEAGVNVVRVGRADKMSEQLQAISLDQLAMGRLKARQFEDALRRVRQIDERVEQLRSHLETLSDDTLCLQVRTGGADRGSSDMVGGGVAPPPPPELRMCGCSREQLNGLYRLLQTPHPELTHTMKKKPTAATSGDCGGGDGGGGGGGGGGGDLATVKKDNRPVYEQVAAADVAEEGSVAERAIKWVCFYYGGCDGLDAGWYVARRAFATSQPPGKKARKAVAGYCSSSAREPPAQGWMITQAGVRQADPHAGFTTPPPPSRERLITTLCEREASALGAEAAAAAVAAARASIAGAGGGTARAGDDLPNPEQAQPRPSPQPQPQPLP